MAAMVKVEEGRRWLGWRCSFLWKRFCVVVDVAVDVNPRTPTFTREVAGRGVYFEVTFFSHFPHTPSPGAFSTPFRSHH